MFEERRIGREEEKTWFHWARKFIRGNNTVFVIYRIGVFIGRGHVVGERLHVNLSEK